MRAFPDFFLTFLGARFLRELYRSFIFEPTAIGLVAIDTNTNNVLGVVVGTLTPEGYFKRLLKKKWLTFCLASIPAIIKRPATIKRLFRALFYRGDPPKGPKRALLNGIAVLPEVQNLGIGKSLVESWLTEIARKGSEGCFLVTDAKNNEKIHNFYRKMGWKIDSEYVTPDGRLMNRYIFDFTDKLKEQPDE